MAEDGLAAGLELLAAYRSQGITSAQPATRSAVTEVADAEMFTLNGSSALLLESVSTQPHDFVCSFMENQGRQLSNGIDWWHTGT